MATGNGDDDKVAKDAALDTVWPAVLIGLALVINLTWIGALAYGIYRLRSEGAAQGLRHFETAPRRQRQYLFWIGYLLLPSSVEEQIDLIAVFKGSKWICHRR
jgi:hypothetical protein